MFIKKSIFIFLLVISFLSFPKNIDAQVIFSDDFNDNNTDDWIVPRNTCSSSWNANNGKYGISTNGCITETIPEGLIILPNTDYIFEVDMTMTSSLNDRNFIFKYQNNNNWYGIHTYQNTLFVQKVVNGQEYFLDNRIVNFNFSAGETYHFKIVVTNDTRYDVYINNIYQLTVYDNTPYFQNYSAGLQASGNSQVWFDNIVVTEIINSTPSPTAEPTITPSPAPTASPSPIPTLEPTISPTASPTPLSLSVPNLKQYSEPWKNKIYDHTRSSIQEFGCALTSAAMVLQFHGHNVLPHVLNDWLKQQPDGYLSNGLINWLAVSRYSKLHDSNSSPTLEYKRLAPTNENLDNELNNNRPAILKENGHFVVATGKLASTYSINDPGYSNRNTLEPYGNTFLTINSYKPTHSDLSYMMFVTDPDIDLQILTNSGSPVPVESYIDEPISSILNPSKKSGKEVKVTLFEKPTNGKYNLKLSGPSGRYELDSYLYDTSGKVNKNELDGSLKGGDFDSFTISFENKKKISEKDKKPDFKFWFRHFHFFKPFWR